MNSPKPSVWAGSWYFVITIVSAGLLAWVPFAYAASRLRRRSIGVLAAAYGVGAITTVVLMSSAPSDTQEQTVDGNVSGVLGFLLMLSLVVGGCVQQVWLRQQVYRGTSGPADAALAAALDARSRRAAARQLVMSDPLIARDLRIGRPDLPHTYDDGGLVDLNSAPAEVIATVCGVPSQVADRIVAARTGCGGLLTVDDVFSLTDLPIGAWDVIRDRGVAIPPTN